MSLSRVSRVFTIFTLASALSAGAGEAPKPPPQPPLAPQPPEPEPPKDPLEKVPLVPLEDGIVMQSGEIKIPIGKVAKVENAYIAGKARQQQVTLQPEEQLYIRKTFSMFMLSSEIRYRKMMENKWDISDEVFNKKFDEFKKAKKQTDGSYEQFLADNGVADDECRRDQRTNWAMEDHLTKELTDDEVKKFMEETKDRMPLRRVSHILYMYKGSKNSGEAKFPITMTKEQAKAKAEDALKKIRAGASFAEVAAKDSDDPGSKARSGDVEFIPRKPGQMKDEPFPEAVYKIEKVGDVSDVVESPFGFHIIKLTEIREPSFFKEQIKRHLIVEKSNKLTQQWVDEVLKDAKFNEKLLTFGPPKYTPDGPRGPQNAPPQPPEPRRPQAADQPPPPLAPPQK